MGVVVPLWLWRFDRRVCGVEGHAKGLPAGSGGGWRRDRTKFACAGRNERRRSLGLDEFAASAIIAVEG
jgi:hypothetical protein